ncbi:MAG: zinc-binding dehydrogenase, partial [Fusobacteriales bacterium]|nr:zinc-binding dehydrogenase [Fusobacteriales bacterium]
GAELVSAFDINESNLEAAKELGADEVYNVAEKDIENEYDKYDIMIETSGANPSFVLILKLAAGKGELLYIGTPHSTLTFEYKDFELINRKELTIKGSWMNYSKPFPGKEWTEAIRLFDEGLVKIDKLIGAAVSMEEFCERLEEIKGRTLGGKIMVKVGESE